MADQDTAVPGQKPDADGVVQPSPSTTLPSGGATAPKPQTTSPSAAEPSTPKVPPASPGTSESREATKLNSKNLKPTVSKEPDPTVELVADVIDDVVLDPELVRRWMDLFQKNRLLILHSWDRHVLDACIHAIAASGEDREDWWPAPFQRRRLPLDEGIAKAGLDDVIKRAAGREERLIMIEAEAAVTMESLGFRQFRSVHALRSFLQNLEKSSLRVLVAISTEAWASAIKKDALQISRFGDVGKYAEEVDFVLPRLHKLHGERAVELAARIQHQREHDLWPADNEAFWIEFSRIIPKVEEAVAERERGLEDPEFGKRFRKPADFKAAEELLDPARTKGIGRAVSWTGAFLPRLTLGDFDSVLRRLVVTSTKSPEAEQQFWEEWDESPDTFLTKLSLQPDQIVELGLVIDYGQQKGEIQRFWRERCPLEHERFFRRAEGLNLLLDDKEGVRMRARELISARAMQEPRTYGAELLSRIIPILAGVKGKSEQIDSLMKDLGEGMRRQVWDAIAKLFRQFMGYDVARPALIGLIQNGGPATALELITRSGPKNLSADALASVLVEIMNKGGGEVRESAADLLFGVLSPITEDTPGLIESLRSGLPAGVGSELLFHMLLPHLGGQVREDQDPFLLLLESKDRDRVLEMLCGWLGNKEFISAAEAHSGEIFNPALLLDLDLLTFWLLPVHSLGELSVEDELFYGFAQFKSRQTVAAFIRNTPGAIQVKAGDLFRALVLITWVSAVHDAKADPRGLSWMALLPLAAGRKPTGSGVDSGAFEERRDPLLMATSGIEKGLMSALQVKAEGRARATLAQSLTLEEKMRKRWTSLYSACAQVRSLLSRA
jgi:hypothetical protein